MTAPFSGKLGRMNDRSLPPTRVETVAMFDAVLGGLMTREDVSSWAGPWISVREREVEDLAVFKALALLGGADLRHGADEPYLFTDGQISEWRVELLAAP